MKKLIFFSIVAVMALFAFSTLGIAVCETGSNPVNIYNRIWNVRFIEDGNPVPCSPCCQWDHRELLFKKYKTEVNGYFTTEWFNVLGYDNGVYIGNGGIGTLTHDSRDAEYEKTLQFHYLSFSFLFHYEHMSEENHCGGMWAKYYPETFFRHHDATIQPW